jgi:endonuclease/exonuclease/phosphatase family metal-dependent hydrolase
MSPGPVVVAGDFNSGPFGAAGVAGRHSGSDHFPVWAKVRRPR